MKLIQYQPNNKANNPLSVILDRGLYKLQIAKCNYEKRCGLGLSRQKLTTEWGHLPESGNDWGHFSNDRIDFRISGIA